MVVTTFIVRSMPFTCDQKDVIKWTTRRCKKTLTSTFEINCVAQTYEIEITSGKHNVLSWR